MLFNSIDFGIFFVVVLSTFVMVRNRRFQHLFLLLASYFFFYYSSNYLITLLIFTTIWDYYLGNAIWKTDNPRRKKLILLTSLAGNLGLLGFFKYSDFAITQFNILGDHLDLNTHIPLLNLVFPIGISFYTFHSLGYILDIYRGHITPSKSLREYAIFIAFFPQLVAGPILRAGQFLPQLREKMDQVSAGVGLRQILIGPQNLKFGITLMSLGFLKKMFFADNIGLMVNDLFVNPVGHDSFTIIIGAVSFAIQIYCDFSGYTDIAIGAAMIMGFKIPANFNKPYFSTSPADFWRRWHISLSTWVRDYLYLPMVFGNRKSGSRILLSLMITFFLLGLWHGPGWNYIIFGVLHGIFVTAETLIRKKFPSIGTLAFFKSKVGRFLSIIATQYLVVLAFIAFRVKDLGYLGYCIQKYVLLDFRVSDTMVFLDNHKLSVGLVILFIILHMISYKKGNLPEYLSKLGLTKWTIFLASIMFIVLFTYNSSQTSFIYFQF